MKRQIRFETEKEILQAIDKQRSLIASKDAEADLLESEGKDMAKRAHIHDLKKTPNDSAFAAGLREEARRKIQQSDKIRKGGKAREEKVAKLGRCLAQFRTQPMEFSKHDESVVMV